MTFLTRSMILFGWAALACWALSTLAAAQGLSYHVDKVNIGNDFISINFVDPKTGKKEHKNVRVSVADFQKNDVNDVASNIAGKLKALGATAAGDTVTIPAGTTFTIDARGTIASKADQVVLGPLFPTTVVASFAIVSGTGGSSLAVPSNIGAGFSGTPFQVSFSEPAGVSARELIMSTASALEGLGFDVISPTTDSLIVEAGLTSDHITTPAEFTYGLNPLDESGNPDLFFSHSVLPVPEPPGLPEFATTLSAIILLRLALRRGGAAQRSPGRSASLTWRAQAVTARLKRRPVPGLLVI